MRAEITGDLPASRGTLLNLQVIERQRESDGVGPLSSRPELSLSAGGLNVVSEADAGAQ